MRKIRILTYIYLIVLFSVPFWGTSFRLRTGMGFTSPISPRDSIIGVKIDSVLNPVDSLLSDSLPKKKSTLDAIVDYVASDSIVLTSENWGYLYGDAKVDYGELTLKAENVAMDMDNSVAKATYGIDTIGDEFGHPIFSEKGVDYEAKSMTYNFGTKKMFVNGVISEQGEGYITAGIAKKTDDDAFFMKDGRYTTCDHHDCPHFYFALTKAKVRPNKNIVTGPAYMVIEGLPLPIGLPFAFFPFSEKYSSGIIMPSFGDEMERGFFLRDGGYYFALSDYMDLTLTGEIYTKGSWGANARSTYKKRYKYSGSFDLGYLTTIYGEKDLPDYSKSKDTRINWTHSQDPKANMYRTLSASVNFSTSSYDRNQLNSVYNSSLYTQNTKASSVTLTQRFPNSPWSLTASMNIEQRSQDSTVSLTLPNLSVNMNRISPFKRKYAIGKEQWYEKIQLSYRGEFRNSILTREDKLLKSDFQKDWKNAVKHSIPVSATYSLFDYLNITPSLNYTERWYTSKAIQTWDYSNKKSVVVDTTYGFNRVFDYNAAISFQTKLYGFFKPMFDKKTTIRHVFTPSISMSYAPDFRQFYDTYTYYDANGEAQEYTYSLYQNYMFGNAPMDKSGNINFQFDNNIEMKRQYADTVKKRSLIDHFGVGFSNNLMADSMNWSHINTNIRLKLSKNLTVNLTGTFDPYMNDLIQDRQGNYSLRRVDKLRISNGKGLGRLQRTGYSISPSINQDTVKKWFGKEKDKNKKGEKENDPNSLDLEDDLDDVEAEPKQRGSLYAKRESSGEYDKDGYMKNEFKWSLSANYSFNYALDNSRIDIANKEYKYKLTHNLGFNGTIQPTKGWNFNFNTQYDFDYGGLTYLNCNLSRDLHCFTLTASFIPIGPYKSYFVSLRANASMLQDLKYDKRGRSSSYDPSWD